MNRNNQNAAEGTLVVIKPKKTRKPKKNNNSNNSKNAIILPAKGVPLSKIDPQMSILVAENRKLMKDISLMKKNINSLGKGEKLPSYLIDYIKFVIDPKNSKAVRVPDFSNVKTFLAKTFMSFDVKVNPDINNGAFAFAVNPAIGIARRYNDYKVSYYPNVNIAYGTNWAMTAPYTELDGTDLVQDAQMGLYTNPTVSLAKIQRTSNVPDTFLGVFGVTTDLVNVVTGVGAPQGSIISQAGTNTSTMTIPKGMWLLSVQSTGNTGLTNVAITPSAGIQYNANVALSNGNYSLIMVIDAKQQGTLTFVDDNTAHGTTLWTFAPTATTNLIANSAGGTLMTPNIDSGAVAGCRCVSMSVLCTNLAPDMYTGGNIATNIVQADTMENNWFNNTCDSNIGQLQQVQNLRKMNDAYDGKLKDGCYTFLQHTDIRSKIFYKPSEMNQGQYPYIVVAGEYLPQDPQPVDVNLLRVAITTGYECTTDDPVINTASIQGTTAMLERGELYISNLPHTMANFIHLDFIRRAISGITKGLIIGTNLISDNKDRIVSGLKKFDSYLDV